MPLRVAIAPDSDVETLPGDWQAGYNSLMVNPKHPMIVSRDHNYRDYYYATQGTRDVPFVARHFFDHGLAGEEATTAFPSMQGSHFSWSGDGSWFLLGNGLMRGRKWDEPFPSNIHFLAGIGVGDVSPCGRSGRWICGDAGVAEIRVADLRSGEGRTVMETNSYLCFPTNRDHSGPYDIDLKGSPDGTKVAFISTYDQKNGPVARITEDPVRPGGSLELPGKGIYTAVAVEWSGLQSKPSLPINARSRVFLKVLFDKPDDFSWTRQQRATQGNRTVVATVHLHDGVIRRSWYHGEEIVERHDLNPEGKATRRLFYSEYCNHGIALWKKKEYDKAISEFGKALKINPKNTKAYCFRANTFYDNGQYSSPWDDVHAAEDLGYRISPRFLKILRDVSGRER